MFAWGLAAALLAGMAGCEEDKQEVTTLPFGRGTIESPYIVQHGNTYTQIPIAAGGAAFFIAEKIPAGWSSIRTYSAVDVDLTVFGFQSLFIAGNGQGSRSPGSGDEAFLALSDGVYSDLFFMVDGTYVRSGGARFDLTVMPAPAPATLTFTMNKCSFAPSSSCDNGSYGGTSDVELPFAMAPSAPLTVTITNTGGSWVYYRTRLDWDSSGYIPFKSNDSIYDGTAAGGYCHANHLVIGSTGVCQINPVSGWSAPRIVRLVNNTNTDGVAVGISFSSS
jgi:hypothetical protein